MDRTMIALEALSWSIVGAAIGEKADALKKSGEGLTNKEAIQLLEASFAAIEGLSLLANELFNEDK